MRLESVLFLLLMILKMVSVIPLAFENMGVDYGIVFLILNIVSYGTLIYFAEKDNRRRVKY